MLAVGLILSLNNYFIKIVKTQNLKYSFKSIINSFFLTFKFSDDDDENAVDVLNQIAQTMGATNWTFGSDACEDHVTIKQILLTDPLRNITCNCQFQNETCHIIAM